jgi:hypothetical protein
MNSIDTFRDQSFKESRVLVLFFSQQAAGVKIGRKVGFGTRKNTIPTEDQHLRHKLELIS